jgi:hypothetical protein
MISFRELTEDKGGKIEHIEDENIINTYRMEKKYVWIYISNN